jgi:uncharacterized membrane protein YhaH (DUF805 family)/heme exporter protein D
MRHLFFRRGVYSSPRQSPHREITAMAVTYFIQRGTKSHGPFSLDQIRGGVRSKKLTGNDRFSETSGGPWSPLSSLLPEVFDDDPFGFDGLLSAGFEEPSAPLAAAVAAEGPVAMSHPPRPAVVTAASPEWQSPPLAAATTGWRSPLHWYFHVWRQYAVFSGRARRQEYWMFTVVNVILGFIVGFVAASNDTPQVASLYSLAVFVPSIAVAVRRVHDTDHRGWFLLIPFYNLYLVCIEGTRGPNRFGPNPKPENEFAVRGGGRGFFWGAVGIGLIVLLVAMQTLMTSHNQRRQQEIDFHRREAAEELRRAEQALEQFRQEHDTGR